MKKVWALIFLILILLIGCAGYPWTTPYRTPPGLKKSFREANKWVAEEALKEDKRKEINETENNNSDPSGSSNTK